ncbi:MAG TPA: chromosome segregation protein SMC [Xanthomonadales bacterium]|nr:chromosome segregation protein SMC [Xanthomonadales bacterium]
MRLTSIKLAGFKSFVDPTTFYAPTNLTGIVGPNGCGKSNIIDAVRWVMGEGSAKVLRGESMADVIFAGSSSRKPVGTATVELLFDNSEGRFGGAYASYEEISVKRQVSRDGVSQYFLNGGRCRRKDVRDLFLGTGLGSSSYSIIEQGMISEIVDARPEDIRGHLEEAAGISRYKERRRETENRIRHTRENLERLADLREEVGKHLNRLKRQASAARRYSKLKEERRQLKTLQVALHWREFNEKAEAGKRGLAERENKLQEKIAMQRKAEKTLEDLRDKQGRNTEKLNVVQGELYDIGSEIARLEQSIEHQRELQKRQDQEFSETSSGLEDIEKHMLLDKAQVEELTTSLAESEPALEKADKAEKEAETALADAESQVASWQEAFEEHHKGSTEIQREADQGRNRIEHLDQRLIEASRRLEALEKEAASLDTAELRAAADEGESKANTGRKTLDKAQARLEALQKEQEDLVRQSRECEQELESARRELHKSSGRLESLLALQQASEDTDETKTWLSGQGLDAAPRLAESIFVNEGWETAAETVLGHWLQSHLVKDLEVDAGALSEIEGGALSLMESDGKHVDFAKDSLAAEVDGPPAVQRLLASVKTCASPQEAMKQRSGLTEGESLVTPEGLWMGRDWLRFARGLGGSAGVLVREKEIASIREQCESLEKSSAELSNQKEKIQKLRVELGENLKAEQQQVNELHREVANLEANRESRQASIEMMSNRGSEIAQEIKSLKKQIADDRDSVSQARAAQEQQVEKMATLNTERQKLEKQRSSLIETRDNARARYRTASEERQSLALRAHSGRASLESLRQSLERMHTRASQLQQRYLSLSEERASREAPEKQFEGEMAALLEKRVATETRLGEERAKVQALDEEYRQQDSLRQEAVQESDDMRSDLERARLGQQEVELKARSLADQIAEDGASVEEVAKDIPDDASSSDWAEQIEDLQIKIQRLEPVNLAAIQEYDEESKRKEYLDSQNDDLNEALNTLENAIARIDKKTRTRFKETFEQVNKGVQELFPRLFGGGHAYLELTGEDLLTTGVSIMARPPGKRVSSIHLLSGGEKALTAVSFVFAIFHLNPAPFCLLDEVDAPLDDANVNRFASMVREMSENVQFVIVTHNKNTMEMIHQLSGVTMREPGVSRLVQVDVDEAARLAAV